MKNGSYYMRVLKLDPYRAQYYYNMDLRGSSSQSQVTTYITYKTSYIHTFFLTNNKPLFIRLHNTSFSIIYNLTFPSKVTCHVSFNTCFYQKTHKFPLCCLTWECTTYTLYLYGISYGYTHKKSRKKNKI